MAEENMNEMTVENNPQTSGTENDDEDLFAYLKTENFTSENFKVEIRNLPKYYGFNELKKLINGKLKLNANKFKSPRKNSPWLYVCFRDEESKAKAINILNKFKWKGMQLNVSEAKAVPDPLVRKRNLNELPNQKTELTIESQDENLKDCVIPYWKIPYDEQLIRKQNDMIEVLKALGSNLAKKNPDLRKILDERKSKYNGLPCELLNIRYTDQLTGYRNKCEFTVGMDEVTNFPTVGFRLGSYVSGFTGVAPVYNLLHLSDKMKLAVKHFEIFVRSSNLKVYNPEHHTGQFKQLTVRMGNSSDQIMLIVGIYPQKMSTEELEGLKQDIVNYFTKGDGQEVNVTSLYYQIMSRKVSDEKCNRLEHLYGAKQIKDKVLDLTFNISPEAFFQVNTAGANVLYNTVIELANPTLESTIIDICCGTGTIGICFAKKCKQVLGVECVPEAVKDARENCELNEISNCEFFCGKAEDILLPVMNRASSDDVIAIVDPPRAGLHGSAILQLRKMKKMNKLVYISCDPKAALKNFIDMGRPESKTLHGNPLIPVRAVAVDMFPYTRHCELVIYFERLQDEQQSELAN